MTALASLSSQGQFAADSDFLSLAGVVQRHAQIVFRAYNPADREEAIAEAVAAAFQSYRSSTARGKHPARDFPSAMATFAALHVKDDRHVGGCTSSTDALSRKAQQKRGFRVEPLSGGWSLPASRRSGNRQRQEQQDCLEECLQDDMQTPVPDQVAFRIDFPAFLATLNDRDRQTALALAEGHSSKEVAQQFGLSAGRISQLRQAWKRGWLDFLGEGEVPPTA